MPNYSDTHRRWVNVATWNSTMFCELLRVNVCKEKSIDTAICFIIYPPPFQMVVRKERWFTSTITRAPEAGTGFFGFYLRKYLKDRKYSGFKSSSISLLILDGNALCTLEVYFYVDLFFDPQKNFSPPRHTNAAGHCCTCRDSHSVRYRSSFSF